MNFVSRKTIRRTVATLVCGLVVVLAIVFFNNDANRYALTNGAGDITEGERFGVNIGDRIEVARSTLARSGFTELFSPSELSDIAYPWRNHYIFGDHGWRRGTVWLEVSEGRVTRIGWRYQFGAP